jgi:hypothetical protein
MMVHVFLSRFNSTRYRLQSLLEAAGLAVRKRLGANGIGRVVVVGATVAVVGALCSPVLASHTELE